jgi:hypothetical protein
MKVTKTYLKQVIKEEMNKMEVEEGRYGGSRRMPTEVEDARAEIERAIDDSLEKGYEIRKEQLASKGKGILPMEEFQRLVEKQKEDWLSSYSAVYGSSRGGDDMEDRNVRGGARIMQLPPALQAVLVAAGASIPHWSVRNNMPESDY